MDHWTTGPGWAPLAAHLVMAGLGGTDDRAPTRPQWCLSRARRALARTLVALAARLGATALPARQDTSVLPAPTGA